MVQTFQLWKYNTVSSGAIYMASQLLVTPL